DRQQRDPLHPAHSRAGSAEGRRSAAGGGRSVPDLRLLGDAVGLERRTGVVHRVVQLREALDVRRGIRCARERRGVEIETTVLKRTTLGLLLACLVAVTSASAAAPRWSSVHSESVTVIGGTAPGELCAVAQRRAHF